LTRNCASRVATADGRRRSVELFEMRLEKGWISEPRDVPGEIGIEGALAQISPQAGRRDTGACTRSWSGAIPVRSLVQESRTNSTPSGSCWAPLRAADAPARHPSG
jgi:hypothetical protein